MHFLQLSVSQLFSSYTLFLPDAVLAEFKIHAAFAPKRTKFLERMRVCESNNSIELEHGTV